MVRKTFDLAGTRKSCVVLAAVAATLLFAAVPAFAANPAPVQLFYVPFPEDQLLQGLQAIERRPARPTNPVTTYISIAAVANNTIIYYDQWENGYDTDIANPLNLYSGGNPGGTQIWGDGNPANGVAARRPERPHQRRHGHHPQQRRHHRRTCPRSTSTAATRSRRPRRVAVTAHRRGRPARARCSPARSRCSTPTAGARTTARPVGENIPDATDHQMFEYTSLAIQAGEGGATVQIDKDANGVFETTST